MKKLLLIVVLIYCFKQFHCQSSCPYFQYIRHNGQTVGQIQFENDYSSDYQIQINLTLGVFLNDKQNVRLELRTSQGDIVDGSPLVYYTYFPIQNPLPRPTRISFNGGVYCVAPADQVRPGRGVTSYWASHSYNTGQPVRKRNRPASANTIPYVIPTERTQWTRPPVRTQWTRPIEVTQWTRPTERTIRTEWTRPTERTIPTPRAVVTRWTPPPTRRTQPTEPSRVTISYQPSPTISTVTQNSNSATNLSEPGCGVASSGYGALIAGKDVVADGQFPWMAGIMYRMATNNPFKYLCTGNIVSPRHVITAAHCIQLFSANYIAKENLLVVLNKIDLEDWFLESIQVTVSDSAVHPQYSANNGDSDVAVLTLTTPLTFKYIKPICLWEQDEDADAIVRTEGTVAGWGSDKSGKAIISEAKYVRMPIVSQVTCLQSNVRFSSITSSRTFCAGNRDGTGPCNGDSGAGFMIERDGKWTLRGIVSRALNDVETCDLDNYVVFADLAKATTWLKSVIRNS